MRIVRLHKKIGIDLDKLFSKLSQQILSKDHFNLVIGKAFVDSIEFLSKDDMTEYHAYGYYAIRDEIIEICNKMPSSHSYMFTLITKIAEVWAEADKVDRKLHGDLK